MPRKIVAALFLLAGLGLAGLAVFRPHVEVPIPEDEVRLRIADTLPMTVSRGGFEIHVTELVPDFLETNAVRVRARAEVAGYGLAGTADADATSGVAYRDGDFYLQGLGMQDIDIALSERTTERLGDVGSVAGALFDRAQRALEQAETAAGDALDGIGARAREQLSEAVRETVDEQLRRTPVYTLNERGTLFGIARLTLVDMRFEDRRAIATLDPGRLIALGAAAVALAIGGLLLALPRLRGGAGS